MNDLTFYFRTYNELSKSELYDIYFLRQEVFILEQNCIYQDIDKKDQNSHHLMAYNNEELVAYLRIVYPGFSYEEPSIGRVLTKKKYRQKGISTELMQIAIQKVRDLYNHTCIRISAQEYLIPFYTSLNFIPIGEVYLEDDIPHIEMLHKD